jgi:hypothetical protein
MITENTPRQKYLRRKTALWNERSSWVSHWREISDYLLPRSGRFFEQDRNRGEKKHNHIYDSTATRALRVLAAGMMSGMTSPARPWFRLAIQDTDMMEFEPVKVWLDDVSKLMREIFSRSNTYRSLHMVYEELGAFGTAATIIRPDFNDVVRHYPLTIGEYALSASARGEIDTIYREVPMTVSQVVEEFGIENVSKSVKNQYDRNNLDQWITVMHAIEPRKDKERSYGKRDAKNMPFKSCYFELAGEGDQMLSESGFNFFPVLAPRWSVAGGDIYGNGPAMEALGDIRQLQHEQLRKAQGIDFQTKPPLQMPVSMKGMEYDTLPGGISWVDPSQPNGAIKSAFEVNLNLQHLLMDIQDVRDRIKGTFYADLFMMMANDTRSGITATEVAERHEEKLLMLGPVLERLHNEMLSPMVENTFTMMLEAGILPPPPKELQGMDLNIEFVSTLAQAQRAIGVGAIDRLLGTVGSIATMKPDVLDKLNADQIVDTYADMLGVDPNLIVGDENVAMIRQQRADQQQKAEQQQQMAMMADTAAKVGGIDTGNPNALTDVMQGLQGYTGQF